MFPIRDRRGRVIGFWWSCLRRRNTEIIRTHQKRLSSIKAKSPFTALWSAASLPWTAANTCGWRLHGCRGISAIWCWLLSGITGYPTTGDHVQIRPRQTSTVVCCYDGDRAGKAAWRALENALEYLKTGNTLKLLFLPDGEDPDII